MIQAYLFRSTILRDLFDLFLFSQFLSHSYAVSNSRSVFKASNPSRLTNSSAQTPTGLSKSIPDCAVDDEDWNPVAAIGPYPPRESIQVDDCIIALRYFAQGIQHTAGMELWLESKVVFFDRDHMSNGVHLGIPLFGLPYGYVRSEY